MNGSGAKGASAPDAASFEQLAERADAPVFWPVRLQQWLVLPGLAGGMVAVLFLLAVWIAAGGDWRSAALQSGSVGEALFFAVSLGLLMELAALIPRAAQGDLDALATELTLEDALRDRLRSALLRYRAGDLAVNSGVGAVIGAVHVALTAPGWSGVQNDPVTAVLALGTVSLWTMMAQTGSLLVANAQLFAYLGRSAVQVEILAPDRLRPFATAALRPMLLIMALLAAYPLMLLGSEGLETTAAIGPVATALLALVAVWVPLRGVAGCIREARAQRLSQLDAAISVAAKAVDVHGAPTDPPRLEALLALRARVQMARSLPIGLGGLGRGLVYLALPVATWGGKGFAEALLNRLF